MATYLPSSAKALKYGQMMLYTPDWSFLTTVLGTKQEQYDKGFEMFKSQLAKISDLDLTNPENQEQYKYALEKIQGEIKKVAATDLSNPQNIDQALSLFDPIINDKDIINDYTKTTKIKTELAKAEQFRNSRKPEERAMYNPYSVQELSFALEDLQNARRGDGSIEKINVPDYIPATDIIGKLNKAAKDLGLKVTFDEINGIYIVTNQNGQVAIPFFEQFAQSQLDEADINYIQQISRVKYESQIREKVKEDYDRDTAKLVLASDLKSQQLINIANRVDELNNAIDDKLTKVNINSVIRRNVLTDDELKTLNSNEQEIRKEIDQYKTLRDELVKQYNELYNQNEDKVAENLPSLFLTTTLQSFTRDWATGYAMATASSTIKENKGYLDLMKLQLDAEFKQMELALKEAQISSQIAANNARARYYSNKAVNEAVNEMRMIIQLSKQYNITPEEAATLYTSLQHLLSRSDEWKQYMNFMRDPDLKNLLNDIKEVSDTNNSKHDPKKTEELKKS